MSDFKERELSKEFIASVLTDIMERFRETKYYEKYDEYGEFLYRYEVSCKNDFIKYIYPLIKINEHNANFDNFNVEFIRNDNYIDISRDEEFLVIVKHKAKDTSKIYTGMKIKKIIEEIDLNTIFNEV